MPGRRNFLYYTRPHRYVPRQENCVEPVMKVLKMLIMPEHIDDDH